MTGNAPVTVGDRSVAARVSAWSAPQLPVQCHRLTAAATRRPVVTDKLRGWWVADFVVGCAVPSAPLVCRNRTARRSIPTNGFKVCFEIGGTRGAWTEPRSIASVCLITAATIPPSRDGPPGGTWSKLISKHARCGSVKRTSAPSQVRARQRGWAHRDRRRGFPHSERRGCLSTHWPIVVNVRRE